MLRDVDTIGTDRMAESHHSEFFGVYTLHRHCSWIYDANLLYESVCR